MSSSPIAAPGEAPIRVSELSHLFQGLSGPVHALAGLSISVGAGEFVALLGPSGCGKSTLLRIIAGLLPVQSGTVTVAGLSPDAARRQRAYGIVFQDPALLPWRTVRDNVRLPAQVAGVRGFGQRADDLIDLVGLGGFAGAYPHELSGGMAQRVALARALALDPPLLLMDEPFGALDEITRTELRHELARIASASSKAVVLVTHSITEAIALADRVLVLTGRPGRLRASVPIELPRPAGPEDEFSDPFVAYARELRGLLQEERHVSHA